MARDDGNVGGSGNRTPNQSEEHGYEEHGYEIEAR